MSLCLVKGSCPLTCHQKVILLNVFIIPTSDVNMNTSFLENFWNQQSNFSNRSHPLTLSLQRQTFIGSKYDVCISYSSTVITKYTDMQKKNNFNFNHYLLLAILNCIISYTFPSNSHLIEIGYTMQSNIQETSIHSSISMHTDTCDSISCILDMLLSFRYLILKSVSHIV